MDQKSQFDQGFNVEVNGLDQSKKKVLAKFQKSVEITMTQVEEENIPPPSKSKRRKEKSIDPKSVCQTLSKPP